MVWLSGRLIKTILNISVHYSYTVCFSLQGEWPHTAVSVALDQSGSNNFQEKKEINSSSFSQGNIIIHSIIYKNPSSITFKMKLASESASSKNFRLFT